MKDIDQLEQIEYHDTKYVRELLEYWNAYIFSLINEIYVGIGIALGLSESEAYRLAVNNPAKLEKAFFKNIFDKFKSIFKYKKSKFRPKKKLFGTGKPLTEKQWEKVKKSISDYWMDHASVVSEDVAVKGFLLGRDTTRFRKKKKPYHNKSLYQVDFDQYNGAMPADIATAYKKFDFKNAEKQALNKSFSDIAMYVTDTNNKITSAIRSEIQSGINDGKSPVEIASDLYWNVQKKDELINPNTAESLRKNWYRIASTELASVYEAGVLSEYESDAMESMKDPKKAQYFVFTGGSCKWCQAHQGTLTRLVPRSIVKDPANDSLSSMGIKDPNTDIAIWIGKNNIGFRETKAIHGWRICTPAHPHNVATMQPIDIETEIYNEKTGNVERRQVKKKFIPQMKDYSYESREEKKIRKPKQVGPNRVEMNGNIYESVAADIYNKKLNEWRKDTSLPIPVNKESPDYKRIFEAV